MFLKSISMKGFKSFPDRTRLEFGEGVSVVVGPNGSGKSNITDAVLWALGEQSPLAVRGQSMQDVIFAGGRGVQARREAEVELVLDNADGTIDLPASELSIVRRLNRSGEGEYRMNGARCRLVDVLEVLSDTGIGKEAHSVVSQGRVEAIVTSKPRDRRLLIEEAAGLGKHRKRRRRAQLKLERTQENLDRSLDIEREARARLRPLKRQAEAAALHERLELQSGQARWELLRDEVRLRLERRAAAEARAAGSRAARAAVEVELEEVGKRREAAELALSERGARRDEIARRAFAARSARDRVGLRHEQARQLRVGLAERADRRAVELDRLDSGESGETASGAQRIAELEAGLGELDRDHRETLERELAALDAARALAETRLAELAEEREARRSESAAAEAAVELARGARRRAELAVEAARREAAGVGAELAAVNQFLRSHVAASGQPNALEHGLEVEAGYELAAAAALGGRLAAAVVADREAGGALLDRAGSDGGRILVAGDGDGDGGGAGDASGAVAGGLGEGPRETGQPGGAAAGPGVAGQPESAAAAGVAGRPGVPGAGEPAGRGVEDFEGPAPGAVRLIGLVRGKAEVVGVVGRLLADAWVVESLDGIAEDFGGIAVTRGGRVWFGSSGELRQVASGGRERALEQRNRRETLIGVAERAAQAEQEALGAGAGSQAALEEKLAERERADRALRLADRTWAEGREVERQAAWMIEQRRASPEQGAAAVRRAQLEGELAAERRALERAERERLARERRVVVLRSQEARDRALAPRAERAAAVLGVVGEALEEMLRSLEAELEADRAAGDGVAAELRACARTEVGLQRSLREHGEAVTAAEVLAAQSRDRAAEAAAELEEVAGRLGLETTAGTEPLEEDQRTALAERIERLGRRREQLGPVNPLAGDEYREALGRVEELESQRVDLETALRELRSLIRDTDKQITDSFDQAFAATAGNFEELVGQLFPGGRGRLRLVREDAGPRAVPDRGPGAGGRAGVGAGAGAASADAEASAEAEAAMEESGERGETGDELMGVEIELTPAGKSMKRLTLLSGGEKSMTAIAFLFAVFLARPCPFYILDEVEAALDDLNIDRFLTLLRAHRSRAQFIVVTHQKRTMEVADWLYGVSMGGDGVSKLVSRRLEDAGVEGVRASVPFVAAATAGAA
ncbi:MAG: chromosome segregation protein [Solirubrobacteraceae bacterium]|jgi:chromosome segregation protein|nr:chromosome segregation protein [Solirubrobacteraceae bacterium]